MPKSSRGACRARPALPDAVRESRARLPQRQSARRGAAHAEAVPGLLPGDPRRLAIDHQAGELPRARHDARPGRNDVGVGAPAPAGPGVSAAPLRRETPPAFARTLARVETTYESARPPLVTNCLVPLTTKPPSSRTSSVCER